MKNYITEFVIITVFLGLIAYHATREQIPEVHVQCKTTKGPLEIVVPMDWSPLGATRFLQLVDDGHFTNLPLFRCIDNFVCQFGPEFYKPDRKTYPPITDDHQKSSLRYFKKGYLSFAGLTPNSRSTHIFLAMGEVPSLGVQPWETPFGYVTDETYKSTASRFNTKYGEMPPAGKGPDGRRIEMPGGEVYLLTNYPGLDYFISCERKR